MALGTGTSFDNLFDLIERDLAEIEIKETNPKDKCIIWDLADSDCKSSNNFNYFIILVFLELTILLGGCKNLNKQNVSAIVIKMSYNSKDTNSHGGSIILQNIDTENYYSGSSRDESAFILLEGIPSGEYKVKQVTISYANFGLNLKDSTWFNTIKIEDPKIYYLGNFHTELMEPEAKFTHSITAIEHSDKDTVLQELDKRKNNDWFDVNINTDQTLFKKSTTIIYRSNKN